MSSSRLDATLPASRPGHGWVLPRRWTRPLLVVDVAACGALGLAGLLAGVLVPSAVSELFGASGPVTWGGVLLLVYAVGAGYVARAPRRAGLWGVAGANVGFAVATVLVVLTAPLTATGLVLAAALVAVSLVVADLMLLAVRGL